MNDLYDLLFWPILVPASFLLWLMAITVFLQNFNELVNDYVKWMRK